MPRNLIPVTRVVAWTSGVLKTFLASSDFNVQPGLRSTSLEWTITEGKDRPLRISSPRGGQKQSRRKGAYQETEEENRVGTGVVFGRSPCCRKGLLIGGGAF